MAEFFDLSLLTDKIEFKGLLTDGYPKGISFYLYRVQGGYFFSQFNFSVKRLSIHLVYFRSEGIAIFQGLYQIFSVNLLCINIGGTPVDL